MAANTGRDNGRKMQKNIADCNASLANFSNKNPTQLELSTNEEQLAQQHMSKVGLNHETRPTPELKPEHLDPASKVSAPNVPNASEDSDTPHTSGSSDDSDTDSESESEINYGDMDAVQKVIQRDGSRCGLVFDERMCAHEDPFDKTHPEQVCIYPI